MPDLRHQLQQLQQLQQLLDHPQADAQRAADPAFTAAVMARLPGPGRASASRPRVLPWCLAGIVLAACCLIPGSWLGEELDPATLLDGATTADSLSEIVIASLAAGALLLVRRRSIA